MDAKAFIAEQIIKAGLREVENCVRWSNSNAFERERIRCFGHC
jgi:hypothetical protein